MMFYNTEKYPFIDWILDGKKTQTRRLNPTPDRKVGIKYPVFDTNDKGLYDFYVLGDAKCWIRLRDIHTQRYGDITEEDASREGFNSLIAFKGAMYDIYGKIDDDRILVVYVFEVVK